MRIFLLAIFLPAFVPTAARALQEESGERVMKPRHVRESERVAARREAIDRRVSELAARLSAAAGDRAGALKKAIATDAGRIVMRDRAEAAARELRVVALDRYMDAYASRHFREGAGGLQPAEDDDEFAAWLGQRVTYHEAYQRHLRAVAPMLKDVSARIPDERGVSRRMRRVMAHETAPHVLYKIIFRKYWNYFRKIKGRITDEDAAKIAPAEVAAMMRTYFENYLVTKTDRGGYTVAEGEVSLWFAEEIPGFARKRDAHAAIDRFADRLSDAKVKAYYRSYLAKDDLQAADPAGFRAVWEGDYDGAGAWFDRHFEKAGTGLRMRVRSANEIDGVLSQVEKMRGERDDGGR